MSEAIHKYPKQSDLKLLGKLPGFTTSGVCCRAGGFRRLRDRMIVGTWLQAVLKACGKSKK